MNDEKPIPLAAYQQQKSNAGTGFHPVSATDIMAMEFEPLRWAVEGYVPEGLSILAGRQKLGKTWLALDFALAVATGGAALGKILCEQGDVLYLDLENGHRRIQQRLAMMSPNQVDSAWGDCLMFSVDCPALDKGLIQKLDEWRLSAGVPRLVVIDVLQRVKPPGRGNANAYENDYTALSELQRWAVDHRISVLVLHHTRKGGAEDPLEALNGSNGLSACADTTLLLDQTANGKTLYVRGRDVEEKETAVQLYAGYWTILGEANEVRRSDQRQAILSALRETKEAMSPQEIADVIGNKAGNVRKLLHHMVKDGQVEKVKRGQYQLPGGKVERQKGF